MSSSASSPDRLGRLADEFLARYRRGERPALTEYAARHPDLAQQIRELFPALLMMEEVRPRPPFGAAASPGEGPPPRLGEYRIVREIGRGGMGVVYEAEQESLGRRVALKVLPPGALVDARHVERFQREARAAARLHHTHIVPVFAVGEESGTHYYVMQYIEGRPLDDVLAELRRLRADAERPASPGADLPPTVVGDTSNEEGLLPGGPSSASVARSLLQGQVRPPSQPESGAAAPPVKPTRPEPPPRSPPKTGSPSSLLSDPLRPFAKSVAQIGVQVAEALDYAASQGVLHRDVKPANLLLDVWGSVWLTDFGLAKAANTPDLTRPGHLLGTMRYMAPERFRGHADIRSDVYALGLTLYEALALRPAFEGRDQVELTRQITTSEPTRLDRINPQLPRDLVTIVHKAMARESGDRYQTAGALAEDLRRFLDGRGIAARRAGLLEQGWRWCRRNPGKAAMTGAMIVLAGVIAGGWLWVRWDLAERQGRARQAVESAIDDAGKLLRGGRRPEATVLLVKARDRVSEADSEPLRRRLDQALGDLDLVIKLEDLWLVRPRLSPRAGPIREISEKYARIFAQAGLGVEQEERALAARIAASSVRKTLTAALEDWACNTENSERQARLLRVARLADPDPKWHDRLRDPALWKDRAAMVRLAEEAPVAELSPQTIFLLATLLDGVGVDGDELLRKAQRRHPDDFWLNYNLSFNLRTKLKAREAESYARVALAKRPESAMYVFLGDCLVEDALARSSSPDKDAQLRDAIANFRIAIDLDGGSTYSYVSLGRALTELGETEEAIQACQRAVDLAPNHKPSAHILSSLADAFRADGETDRAIEAYRKAAEANPEAAVRHYRLGMALQARGDADEALAAFKRAADGPNPHPEALYQLGKALQERGDLAGAVAAFWQAAKHVSHFQKAHAAVATAQLQRGRLTEARDETLLCTVLPWDATQRAAFQRQLKLCDRMLALEARLSAIRRGESRPANAAEQRELARLCQDYRREYASAVRLYADAFAAQPALADDLAAQDRYRAARAAALAGCGRSEDASRLNDGERANLRRQALAWLAADADAWSARLLSWKAGDRVRAGEALREWRREPDLAGVREPQSLEKLPEGERAGWRKLWARVERQLTLTPAGQLGQAREHMGRREWGRAARCYGRALTLGAAEGGHFDFEYAALLLLSGEREGYAKVCARMAERCKPPSLRAYHVARAGTLGSTPPVDPAVLHKLAGSELHSEANKDQPWSLTEQAALHCRAGRFADAVPLLRQSFRSDPRPGCAVVSWLWLALAHQRQGNAKEARRWMDKARRWMDSHDGGFPSGEEDGLGRHLHNALEAQVLRREAEALLTAR
jgi:tetratricopeptide (TPR) repeat protein